MTPDSSAPDFDARVAAINELYRLAPARQAQGERTLSTDELSGLQVLERKHPPLPMQPGHVERREFEYIRHGTLAAIFSRDVASGQLIAPTIGHTRTAADFLSHIQGVVATDPQAVRWHIALDNLNTHCSAELVEWVASESDLDLDLGVKGKSGILHSMQSRRAFLSDPTHHVVFYYTPKHCSWLNQIEIWLSILTRKLLKRGSFTSWQQLRDKILAFIQYYNASAAPFKWTTQGKTLVA